MIMMNGLFIKGQKDLHTKVSGKRQTHTQTHARAHLQEAEHMHNYIRMHVYMPSIYMHVRM